ncbi:MAG: ATP-dependent DNA ligase [Myxococcales bacterium]
MQPMLAELARELPRGDFLYEPKWDGFRCLASVTSSQVELRSRNGRPLARYFPEIVAALARLPDVALDGELMIATVRGSDFGALLNRVHPSQSRVDELSRTTPASYVVFDLIDEPSQPFAERRARLEKLPLSLPIALTPLTDDPDQAGAWLADTERRGIDGVVAKHRASRYEPGRRGWIKVKPLRTAECVVGGFRPQLDVTGVASLLLGLYDGGALIHVGVASQFRAAQRRELFHELVPIATALERHPWEHGFNLGRSPMGRLPGSAGRWVAGEMTQDWVPVRPIRVCEVAYDKIDEGVRFRHPARFLRWRPDRDARSCLLDQLAC